MRFFEVDPDDAADDAAYEIQWLAEGENAKYFRDRRGEGHDAGTFPDARAEAKSGRDHPAARKCDSNAERPCDNTHAEDGKPGGRRPGAIARRVGPITEPML